MKKTKKILLISSLFSFAAFLFLINISMAQNKDDSIDAIGVRIMPNPNHYSISRWYDSQGFFGSPQALIVDGYEAIRDGRTVYVNAANIVDKTIYTNIYIISYNQDPSQKTIDILGQIVSRWKFNKNLEAKEIENPATCSISSLSCNDDSDCGVNSFCSKSGISSGSCQLKKVLNCRVDTDCPSNFFCDSDKAKITRDIRRIGRLDEMKEALANYYRSKGNYPLLNSGTYLSGRSISVWPSWQQLFLSDIAVSPNLIDPINRLGYCPGYEQKTCWNIEENKFYSNPSSGTLVLPEGSYAMMYSSNELGSNYSLCAVLESRHPSLAYRFSSNNQDDSACVTDVGILTGGRSDNVAPILIDYNLSGQAGKEFNGFIKVFDENNDPLTWELVRGNDNWSSWSADFPKILDTSNKYQKKIHASSAGLKPGEILSKYPLSLRVSDGRGGVLEKELEVEIQDFGLFIEAQNASHVLDKNNPFVYNIYVSGENFNNPDGVFIRDKSNPSLLPKNIFSEKNHRLVSQNRYQITFSGSILPDYQLAQDKVFDLEVVARDKNNREFKKPFSLKLISEKPVLQFSCSLSARAGKKYSCFLGRANYFGNNVIYQSVNQPNSLKIEEKEEEGDVYLEGVIDLIENNQAQNHEIIINAVSEYGAVNSRKFNLKVNTSCGDGIKQEPNSEGKGGVYNDGFEQCDGEDGVAKSASESSVDRQYACSTGPSSEVPREIRTRDYCVFKQSLGGGGYCGDGFCQTSYEDKNTCPVDCGHIANPVQTICGNGVCEVGENNTSCPQDCPATSTCGDGVCSGLEDPYSCPQDCGTYSCQFVQDCPGYPGNSIVSYTCDGAVGRCRAASFFIDCFPIPPELEGSICEPGQCWVATTDGTCNRHQAPIWE